MLKCESPIDKPNSPTQAWDKPNGESTSGKPLWQESYFCSTIALLPKKNGVGGSGVRWDGMGAVSAKSARETTLGGLWRHSSCGSRWMSQGRRTHPGSHSTATSKARGLAKKMFNPTLAQAILDPENLTKLMG